MARAWQGGDQDVVPFLGYAFLFHLKEVKNCLPKSFPQDSWHFVNSIPLILTVILEQQVADIIMIILIIIMTQNH